MGGLFLKKFLENFSYICCMVYNKAIDQFISYCLEPHEERVSEKYPESLFWVKGGEIITEIKKSEYFWLDYHIWIRISEMFGLDYDETQSVIKVWLEQHYNLGGLTPSSDSASSLLLVGTTL